MRHIWSRKAKIQLQMAASGNADIFSIKVDSRLKTILFPTGVATEVNFNSVLFQKFISSPKCRFRECSWRGIHKMPDQPKTPLKLVNLAEIFTGNSVYIREWFCIGLAHSRATLRISISGVWGPMTPSGGKFQIYHNIANMKPKF